jgi:hypothetical protein
LEEWHEICVAIFCFGCAEVGIEDTLGLFGEKFWQIQVSQFKDNVYV